MKSSQFDVRFTGPLPRVAGAELARRVYYLSDDICGFSLIEDEAGVYGVRLEVSREGSEGELKALLIDAVFPMLVRLRQSKSHVIWSDEGRNPPGRDPREELLKRGDLHWQEPGQISLSGSLLELFELVDDTFAALATSVFNASPYRFPTLLPTRTLQQGGYLERFPQYLFFVNRMKNSKENFDRFAAHSHCCSHAEYGDVGEYAEFTTASGVNLPPAVCYHVYEMLAGRTLERDQCLTLCGKSFRHEHKYSDPLTRLWDFSAREVVFLGQQSYVDAGVTGLRAAAIKLAMLWGLKGRCESATDPFFVTGSGIDLANSQRLTGAKFELRLGNTADETVAVSSFNYHGQYLARAFNIQSAGDYAPNVFTGCVAIGLERFAMACVTQWGADPVGWPAEVRRQIELRRRESERARRGLLELFNAEAS